MLPFIVEQTYATDSNHTLKITFAEDPTKSRIIDLSHNQTQTVYQNKTWNQNNDSRFNLISYSIDGGTIIPIPRDNHTFAFQVSTDANHQIVFYSILQHFINVEGTDVFKFIPPSPTHDKWFDENSVVTISVPHTIQNQESTRKQLVGWSTDSSYINIITRNESGVYKLSNINANNLRNIDFDYKNQYYIDVKSDFGRPIGSGWYDENSIITISVIPDNDFILNRHFSGWEGAIIGQGGQESANVLVSFPQTIIAKWQEDFTVPSIFGIAIIAVVVGVIIYHKRRPIPK